MEAGFIILVVAMTAIGGVVGYLIGKRKTERRYTRDTQYTQGTLNVDCVNPEFPPSMYLGLSVPVESVISRKYVSLDVNVMLSNSRK